MSRNIYISIFTVYQPNISPDMSEVNKHNRQLSFLHSISVLITKDTINSYCVLFCFFQRSGGVAKAVVFCSADPLKKKINMEAVQML